MKALNDAVNSFQRLKTKIVQTYSIFGKEYPVLDDLNCSNCGEFICTVDAFDLEGSDFYCTKCVKRAKDELHS
jgi:formylmethanofuran dehydrogenase subunit E